MFFSSENNSEKSGTSNEGIPVSSSATFSASVIKSTCPFNAFLISIPIETSLLISLVPS